MSAYDRFQPPSLADEYVPPCCDDCTAEYAKCVIPCGTLKAWLAEKEAQDKKDTDAQYKNWLEEKK